MTNRRKRWLRRFAIGVSLAAFAAPAAAKPTPAGGGGGVALQQSAIQRPDDRSARFTVGQQVVLRRPREHRGAAGRPRGSVRDLGWRLAGDVVQQLRASPGMGP